MTNLQSKLIADQIDNTRALTRFYLSKLKKVNVYKSFELNGIKLNPIIWEIGHLAVSQNWLVLYLGFGTQERIPWAKEFALGSVPAAKKEDYPSYLEIWETFKRVHNKSIDYVNSLSDDKLALAPKKEIPFIKENNLKHLFMHSIRHEGIHAGHLSWHCKLFGIKTI
tara:strand:+ start:4376 stop:4876 length:501 start_codon:yes stop_codon:yes gene_type:complete